MKKADTDYVVVGKIGSTYGIKGWLKIFSFTANISNLLNYDPWYIDEQGWHPIEVKEGRIHGKGLIVCFAGCDTPEKARVFTGKMLAIKRSQLPTLNKNEYYWSDLEGLTVINQRGETLGEVSYFLETGANDVFIVKGKNNKEFAIPYLLNKVITQVDLEKKILYVNWELI